MTLGYNPEARVPQWFKPCQSKTVFIHTRQNSSLAAKNKKNDHIMVDAGNLIYHMYSSLTSSNL